MVAEENEHRYTSEFDPENRLARVIHRGKLTLAGLIAVADTLQTDPRFEPGGGLLADFREADFTGVSSGDVRNYAEHLSEIGSDRHSKKVAVVVKAPLDYGMVRMFQAFAEINRLPSQDRLFDSVEDAEKWLGVN